MKRKRLQHIANTFCHKFCGLETFSDYNELVKLGSGKLIIDGLSGDCLFDDSPIRQLNIAKALNVWLRQECNTNKIDMKILFKAELNVELEFSNIRWNERRYSLSETFFAGDREVKTEKMHRCCFSCTSIVKTDEKNYESVFVRTREWPYGWPKLN